MDRHLWTQELSLHYCPPWPCRSCQKGTLALINGSVTFKETVESIRSHNHENFDADWITYAFTAWAQCTHPTCRQEYAIAGMGGVAPQWVSEEEWEWDDYFAPKFCYPMPDIISIPAKCPEDVQNELRAAFSLFWSNPAACAGRMRVSLESLMNHLGVPKTKVSATGKIVDQGLHDRIDAYAKSAPEIGMQLMALKWLGNTASHESDVSKTDLLDAFEIMEHALGEIIGGHSAKVAALAKKLIEKHEKK